MNKTIRILLFGLLLFSCSEEGTTIERQFLPLKINETSGLEYYNNNFLTHNDSGGETILYEFNKEGNIVDEHFIENCGENNDWEDITADSKNIYIANSGNNYGTRQNLAVLILDKENDFECTGQIQFKYKNQINFENRNRHPYDSEGIISVGDELILFSKDRENLMTELYSLPKIPGLCGKSIDKVELYSFDLASLSRNLPCQCFLIDALAFPVLLDDSQCKDGETFFEVIIFIISPFFNDDCRGDSLPLISQPIAVSPILV